MSIAGSFESDRHPRGWHGRFAGSGASNAHAMRGARRPSPHPAKRAHAVVPHLRGGLASSVGVKGTIVPLPGD